LCFHLIPPPTSPTPLSTLFPYTTLFRSTAAILHPDLVADYLNQRPEAADATGGYYEHGQGNLGGTPWEYRERYLANSPIYQFDQIETPLLIGQGNKDGNLIASDAIFAALT